MRLSIVVPAYNESAGILKFHNELLMPAIRSIEHDYEIIYVNDGSSDNTLEKLTNIAEKDSHIRVVNLSRNFGKEIATTAGISQAKGDAIIVLDADGQHPPALISQFVEKWQAGAQVVVGIRNTNQKEGIVKKLGSKLFYKLFNGTSGVALIPRSTDFRLFDREVQQEFIKFTERNRITRGLIDWLGYKRDYIYFDSPARLAGEASYSISSLIKLAFNSFISLSLKPLFVLGWIGLSIMVLSMLFGLFIIIEQFILGDPLGLHFSGSVMLGVFTAFMVSLVLISQSVTAAYLSHIYSQTQERPLFVIDKKHSKRL